MNMSVLNKYQYTCHRTDPASHQRWRATTAVTENVRTLLTRYGHGPWARFRDGPSVAKWRGPWLSPYHLSLVLLCHLH